MAEQEANYLKYLLVVSGEELASAKGTQKENLSSSMFNIKKSSSLRASSSDSIEREKAISKEPTI